MESIPLQEVKPYPPCLVRQNARNDRVSRGVSGRALRNASGGVCEANGALAQGFASTARERTAKRRPAAKRTRAEASLRREGPNSGMPAATPASWALANDPSLAKRVERNGKLSGPAALELLSE